MSDSLRPHGQQRASLPCPSPTPQVCSNSCKSSWWCHQIISSSVVPFFCLQLSRQHGLFQRPIGLFQFLKSCGQGIGASASASILPKNILDWFPLVLTGWISLKSKGLLRVFSNTTQFKSINSLALSFFYGPTLTSIHDYSKNHSFDYTDLCWQSNVSAFYMLSRLVIAFLPRSKHLLITWLQWFWICILEPKKIKVFHCFHYFTIYLPWNDGARCHDPSYMNVEF